MDDLTAFYKLYFIVERLGAKGRLTINLCFLVDLAWFVRIGSVEGRKSEGEGEGLQPITIGQLVTHLI